MKYSAKLTEQITELYTNGMKPEEIAVLVNLPSRSIITKLSLLGIYKPKRYLTKQGEPPVKKEAYIVDIARLCGVAPDSLDTLEKANKAVLKLLVSKLSAKG